MICCCSIAILHLYANGDGCSTCWGGSLVVQSGTISMAKISNHIAHIRSESGRGETPLSSARSLRTPREMGAVVGRWRDTSKWSQSNQNTSRHILVDGSKYTPVDNIRTHIIIDYSEYLPSFVTPKSHKLLFVRTSSKPFVMCSTTLRQPLPPLDRNPLLTVSYDQTLRFL